MTRRVRAASHETVRETKSVAFAAARRIASQILSRWQKGERADAQMALKGHPELLRYRSIALNLVYEDYCRRLEEGEAVDPEAFAAQFPEWQTAVRRQIEVHSFLAKYPDISGPETPPAWPSPGDRFLGYDLQEELGRGAIARVYLAKEIAVGNRLVALKVSPGGAAEAQFLGRLDHPNIVPILSVQNEEASGLSAVCMPYRGRLTLNDLIVELFRDGRQPTRARDLGDAVTRLSEGDVVPPTVIPHCRRGSYVDAVLRLMAQMTDALAYTHGREMLHRDLKPSNILLSNDGKPMLLDFNLSADEQKTISRIGGTLPYMAPEQIRQVMFYSTTAAGNTQEDIDRRADIYSLGVIAYELLTGVQPFEDFAVAAFSAESAEELLSRQAARVPPVSQLNPQVNRQISSLVAECMAFDVDARPATAEELGQRIRELLRLLRRASRWLRLHWIPSAVAAVLIAAAVATGATWYATRPTPWQVAVGLLNDGRAAEAQQQFQGIVDANRHSPLAWFALGCAQLKSEPSAVAARRSFQEAYDLTGDPRLLSLVAYCDGVDDRAVEASKYLEDSIEAGDRDAINYYNRAVALRFASSFAYHLAIDCCDSAIAIDRELIAATYLRGWLRFMMVASKPATEVGRREELLKALEDLIDAADRAPGFAQYHFDAARVAAQLAKYEDDYRSTAALYLVRAVEWGLPVDAIRSDAQLMSCLSTAQEQEMLGHSKHTAPQRPIPTYLLPALLHADLPVEHDADWQRAITSSS